MSRFGKSLKTKTVHGVRTGAHSNPNVLRSARAYGGSCGEADGGSARPSFAKASRMKRADGGPTISEDSKKEIARIKGDVDAASVEAGKRGAVGAGLGYLAAKGLGKAFGVPARLPDKAAFGTIGALSGMGSDDSGDVIKNGVSEMERLRKGRAEPGKEDRKRGGSVMARAKMRDGSKWKKGDATENESGREYKNGGWIAGATKNKGALHKALGVPQGEKIPEKKLEKAEHSDNPTMRKRAALAETLKGFKK